MGYDPGIHHRRSIRLREFDYSSAGAYFVTICAQGRERLFGDIADGVMCPNDAGRMAAEWWSKIPDKFPGVATDDYVVMPNHFHGIVIITPVGADPCVRPDLTDPCVRPDLTDPRLRPDFTDAKDKGAHAGPPLHRVMQWFKTMTTNAYIMAVKEYAWPPFPGRLWQRNYYERVIRDDAELNGIREYIRSNPANWVHDDEYTP